MEGVMLITIVICCSITAIAVNYMLPKNKYCNSNYNRANEYSKLEIDYPEYEVHEIHERSCSNQGPCMAEYVLWNFYLKGKDNVWHQELIIYDEVGKYNIGDKLIFTKYEKLQLEKFNLIMRKNMYPLPTRTVLYSHRKHMKPVPEVGKKYHCFDDGKVRFSRHFIITVDEVLGHQQFKKKYPKEFEKYREAVRGHYWLYSTHSDKFIITHKGENGELGVYVRTKQGGWFGIGPWWDDATLDSTGELWDNLVKDIDSYDYTEEEKKQIIEEGTI